jgi:DNA gyrase inhibitor GyrI
LIDVYNSIFGNWLYSSDIILRDEPIFQKFLNNKFEVPEDALLAEVYVPIE